jgi:hypothetical protein
MTTAYWEALPASAGLSAQARHRRPSSNPRCLLGSQRRGIGSAQIAQAVYGSNIENERPFVEVDAPALYSPQATARSRWQLV